MSSSWPPAIHSPTPPITPMTIRIPAISPRKDVEKMVRPVEYGMAPPPVAVAANASAGKQDRAPAAVARARLSLVVIFLVLHSKHVVRPVEALDGDDAGHPAHAVGTTLDAHDHADRLGDQAPHRSTGGERYQDFQPGQRRARVDD